MKRALSFFMAPLLLVATVILYALTVLAHETGEEIPGPRLAEPIEQGRIRIRLETVATGLVAPVKGAVAPGDPRLFVADQVGKLWAVDLATGAKTEFLDVSGRLVTLGRFGPFTFDERGFLGIAFHPDYQTNGLLYTYTSELTTEVPTFPTTMPPMTTADHQDVIAEWRVPHPGDPASVVDLESRRELVRIDHPQFNHNAGDLNFGPDGMLYISDGDGGGADDQDGQIHPAPPDLVVGHQGGGNAQKLNVPLGKILRIDPLGTTSANGQYGIPSDNPFVGESGVVEEIYAFGFRNPYRFSFDSATGDLYVGDVGQNDIEEVNIVVSGGNYGWNCREGAFFFDPKGFEPGSGTATPDDPGRPECRDVPTIDPIAQYDTHNEGHSVVGGFVYRGSRIPQLHGRYVFGDFSLNFVNRVGTSGRLLFLQQRRNPKGRLRDIKEFSLVGQDALGLALFGFGQDHEGELYVLGNATGIPFPDRTTGANTGVVLRMTPRRR